MKALLVPLCLLLSCAASFMAGRSYEVNTAWEHFVDSKEFEIGVGCGAVATKRLQLVHGTVYGLAEIHQEAKKVFEESWEEDLPAQP